jgi:hypothetical protein
MNDVSKRIGYVLLAVAALLTSCTKNAVSVCELIENPAKWEKQIVTIRGAVAIRQDREPAIDGIFLMPTSDERCSYEDSPFISADEFPEIVLRFPEGAFLDTRPDGFSFRRSSFPWRLIG